MRSFLLSWRYAKEAQQRVEGRDIGVESHWLNQVRLSASGGLLRLIEGRFAELS